MKRLRIALLTLTVLLIGQTGYAAEDSGLSPDSPIPLAGVTEYDFFRRILGPCGRLVRAEFVETCCPRKVTVPGVDRTFSVRFGTPSE